MGKKVIITLSITILFLMAAILTSIFFLYSKDKPVVEIEKDSSDIALDVNDFPPGWDESLEGMRKIEDISLYQKSLGWREGYEVLFTKDENYVYQLISVYPLENTSVILNTRVFPSGIRNHWLDEFKEKQDVILLEKVMVGEDSISYKLVSEDGLTIYYISFIKNRFYVEFSSKDFDLIKGLAIKTSAKIV